MPTNVKISIEPASENYFLNKSDRYKYSTVVITTWLTVTKYPYLTGQWNISVNGIVVFPLSKTTFVSDLTMCTTVVSYEKQEVFNLREHMRSPPRCLVGSVLLIFLAFFVFVLCCVPNVVCVSWFRPLF
jgi:hypothetical protein